MAALSRVSLTSRSCFMSRSTRLSLACGHNLCNSSTCAPSRGFAQSSARNGWTTPFRAKRTSHHVHASTLTATIPLGGSSEAVPSTTSTQPAAKETLPQSTADEKHVSVTWQHGTPTKYHHMWLRDHCRCEQCFHPVTKQRLLNTFEIPTNVRPQQVESTADGLHITWPTKDAHISLYPWHWLAQNSYDPPMDKSLLAQYTTPSRQKNEKILWSSKIKDSPPTVQFEQVMKDDRARLKWLQNIEQFGFCFVEGVPATPEDTELLTKRIGPIRHTQYGDFWDFTADLAHGDTAYTNMALGAHTDTTYFTDPCGLQLFHLLVQGQGGSTLLVDGFYAASILRQLHPEHFDTLTKMRISTHAAGGVDSMYKPSPNIGYPILTLAEEGFGASPDAEPEVRQVRYNNDDRSVLRMPPSDMEAWYEALRAWNRCLTSADSEYWVQLAPGTVVVLDNHRVLHGRSAFTGKRRMCGAYVGADDFKSRLWCLSEGANAGWPQGRTERNKWDPAF